MPLRKPTEVSPEFVEALKNGSEESMGCLFRLPERCAIAALDEEECITPALIAAVASGAEEGG